MGNQGVCRIAAGAVNAQRRKLIVAAAALAGAGALPPAAVQAYDLDEIGKRGVLRIAVYKAFPPFSDSGRGIDVDIAHALAAALGVKAALLPFDAGENVDDDLRNMVWRGHYLGYGPADVMLHAPLDALLMNRSKQVAFLAPYYREKLQIVRDMSRIRSLGSLAALQEQPVGAEEATLASTVLLAAEGGRLRHNVRHFRSTVAAVEALKRGQLAAVVGPRSELLAGLGDAGGFELTDVPVPGAPAAGWLLGLAIKRENEALGRALDAAIKQLIESGEIEAIFRRHGVAWLRPG
jgi:ABC-type amino acid transport substrate-binding protein